MAVVDDHVQFHRAFFQSLPSFGQFGFGGRTAVRKSDNSADQNIGISQQPRRQFDVIRLHAHRSRVVLRRQCTTSQDFSLGQLRLQQRVVNGFGELTLVISKTGALLQWNSRLLPKLDLPARTLIEAKGLSDKFIGRTFNYSSVAGQPLSYKASKREDIAVKDLVVYPKQTGTRLTLHLAYPVEVGDGMTWTVYVDAVTGDELEVKQNFAT